jgi:hypothetical protein
LQGHGQHTIRELGLNLVGVDLERQPKRPPKAAPPALAAMVGSGVLGLILPFAAEGDRVPMNGDLELVPSAWMRNCRSLLVSHFTACCMDASVQP